MTATLISKTLLFGLVATIPARHAQIPIERPHNSSIASKERSLSKGDDQTYYETEAAGHLRPGGALMLEPGMRLFVVQCRHNGGEATTGFVPALNPEEAILRARTTVREVREQDSSVTDPFEDPVGLEVRVGTFDPMGTEIVFGDWSPFLR